MSGPSPDNDEARTVVGGKAELVSYLEEGAKPRDAWRIGTEHEKFPFLTDSLRPVPYEGKRSIRALLEGLNARFGWPPIMEGKTIIGLSEPDGGGSISLEPGGQFELSGAPLETIHETCSEITQHLKETRAVAEPMGVEFLGLGFSPTWSFDETPMMPKGRYGIMKA